MVPLISMLMTPIGLRAASAVAAVVVVAGVVAWIRSDAVSDHEAQTLRRDTGKLINALEADADRRRRDAAGGLLENDGLRRD